jgi:hypothetical protein
MNLEVIAGNATTGTHDPAVTAPRRATRFRRSERYTRSRINLIIPASKNRVATAKPLSNIIN